MPRGIKVHGSAEKILSVTSTDKVYCKSMDYVYAQPGSGFGPGRSLKYA